MKRIIFGLMLAMMFCTLMQGANRTVTDALLHGRPKHRKDCRYHRMSGGNGKKPPLAGERQNGFLLKTKWL